jgi:hypothetical protein
MAEAKAFEAGRQKGSRARARRRRVPLREEPWENLAKEAKGLMGCALRLRNRDPRRAERAAERAFGSYLSASRKADSERQKADLLVEAGKALSFAAFLCEKRDTRRAGRMHEEAGDCIYSGARHGAISEASVKALAKREYERAWELGGNARVLERKMGTCDR